MKTIAIINQKGGVGKTTTTINLGVSLAEKGKKILLVDLDAQANLTMSLGFEPDEIKNTITTIIENRVKDYNYKININNYILNKEGVDLIPSDIGLSSVDVKMLNALNRESILKNIIKEFKKEYDYIIIDCPPTLGLLTINALVAANSIIIPVQAQFLSIKGMEQLFDTVMGVKTQINPELEIEGILITMYKTSTNLSKEVLEVIKNTYGSHFKIFKNIIKDSTKVAEAPAQGQSLIKYNPKNDVTIAYQNLADEVLKNE